MRRKELLRLDDQFIDYVFQNCKICYVAFIDGSWPYCLPFNYIRIDSVIYIHSAKEGHKLDCLAKNPNVAFALACDITIVIEKSTTWYKSLSGKGKITIVNEFAEKQMALDALSMRYNAKCQRPATPAMIGRTEVLRIDIIELTGKSSPASRAPL